MVLYWVYKDSESDSGGNGLGTQIGNPKKKVRIYS